MCRVETPWVTSCARGGPGDRERGVQGLDEGALLLVATPAGVRTHKGALGGGVAGEVQGVHRAVLARRRTLRPVVGLRGTPSGPDVGRPLPGPPTPHGCPPRPNPSQECHRLSRVPLLLDFLCPKVEWWCLVPRRRRPGPKSEFKTSSLTWGSTPLESALVSAPMTPTSTLL